MEEFGDWIYFLVIIIAGVSSLIGSTRKKAKQVAEQKQPREIITVNNENDDYWDDFIPKAEKETVVNVIPKQKAKPVYKPAKSQKTPLLDILQEGQSSLQFSETLLVADDEYSSITIDDLPDNTDEWRKAFIYNEIFNRKN